MRKYISVILIALMLLTLCACENDEPQPTPEPTPEPTQTAAPTPTPPIATYNNHGKRISVYSVPEKVVTAGPNCTEVMCALGLYSRVIGKCMTNHSLGALPELTAAYDSIPVLSIGYPTLEDILNSGCDFLYASPWIFNDTLTVEALEQNGILVYVNEADDFVDIWIQLRDLGRIFGVEEESEKLYESEKERIDAVAEVLMEVEPKSVLVVDSILDEGLVFTAGSGNIETSYIKYAGCKNVFADLKKPWDVVTADEVEMQNPDFIIIHDYSGSSFESTLEAIKEDLTLSRLDCVRNGRIIRLPLENLMPGVRSADTVEKIAYTVFYEQFAASR